MKNLKLIVAVSGLTLVLGACAKHAVPNYYDDNGNKIAFADYKISKECAAQLGFNVNREVKVTHDKYDNSQSYRVHTAYIGDKVTDMSAAAAKQGANADEIAAATKDAQNVQAGENYALLYPSDRSVSDTTKSIDNLEVDQHCGPRTAQYSGPGTTSHITGAIKSVSTTSFEIDGSDETTGQSVDVVISRNLPDPTVPVKGAKLPALLAKNEDDNGRYTIQIVLTKKATTSKNVVVNQRVVTFLQTVVDDVTTKTTIGTEVAAEYLNALDPNILKDMKTSCAADSVNLKTLPQSAVLKPLCAAKPSDATIDIAKVSDLMDLSTVLLKAKETPAPPPAPVVAPAPAAAPGPTADSTAPVEEQGPPSPAPKVETPAAAPAAAPPPPAPDTATPAAGDAAPAPVTAKNS